MVLIMIEAVSCGGLVIYRNRILVLYKNYKNRNDGWVLPKGTVEPGESNEETAVREVFEEGGSNAKIIKYIDKTEYSFSVPGDTVTKSVHWFLMKANSYDCVPQKEEYFRDAGFYKYHEAAHLLKFSNERQILEKGYAIYNDLRRNGLWDN